jgi:hypothetical protein
MSTNSSASVLLGPPDRFSTRKLPLRVISRRWRFRIASIGSFLRIVRGSQPRLKLSRELASRQRSSTSKIGPSGSNANPTQLLVDVVYPQQPHFYLPPCLVYCVENWTEQRRHICCLLVQLNAKTCGFKGQHIFLGGILRPVMSAHPHIASVETELEGFNLTGYRTVTRCQVRGKSLKCRAGVFRRRGDIRNFILIGRYESSWNTTAFPSCETSVTPTIVKKRCSLFNRIDRFMDNLGASSGIIISSSKK